MPRRARFSITRLDDVVNIWVKASDDSDALGGNAMSRSGRDNESTTARRIPRAMKRQDLEWTYSTPSRHAEVMRTLASAVETTEAIASATGDAAREAAPIAHPHALLPVVYPAC